MLGALALVFIGFVLQMAEALPALSGRLTPLRWTAAGFVHGAVIAALVRAYSNARKGQPWPVADVLLMAMLVVISWTVDFGIMGFIASP
jgi:hypothetical protein